jgi:hypothetical protein
VAWVDMSVSTTLIKVKTILSSAKFSHSAQLGVHGDDDEGRISLRDLTLPRYLSIFFTPGSMALGEGI